MQANDFYEHLIKDIIPFWNRMKDEENGGFYGFADANGIPDKTADKGVLLTCRILWFYSAASSFLRRYDPSGTAPESGCCFREPAGTIHPEAAWINKQHTDGQAVDPDRLLQTAGHVFRFFKEHCIDPEKGGVYWTVRADGSPADTTKYTYNMAFAIYALSAYYEASGRKDVLDQAYAFFRLIEGTCKDEKGYLEAFSKDFEPVQNDALSENGIMAERTMNTLLHLLESYTAFYQVTGDPEVGEKLKGILRKFRTDVYNPEEKRCEVFFDDDFHSLIDLESYGHDIETSWLLDRACEVLADLQIKEEMRGMISGLAEGALLKGMDTAAGALNYECDRGKVKQTKNWWPQAESVIGFYNAWQNGSDGTGVRSSDYLQAAETVWTFVREHVIDKKQGEWIEDVEADLSVRPGQPLVHLWKCPYHTGRLCMEMAGRLRGSACTGS